MAVRRSPTFRFDYFLRSLPVELLGKRCEQLMKAAEKEVEHLEKQVREAAGLPVEPEKDGGVLPPVELPKFSYLQKQMREARKKKAELERRQLEEKVEELEAEMRKMQDRLKELNTGAIVSPDDQDDTLSSEKENRARNAVATKMSAAEQPEGDTAAELREDGAIGPDGNFVEFPEYDGSEPPNELKKPFTHFCNHTRKEVKAELDPAERRNKVSAVTTIRGSNNELN
jgi:DNA repair exonuclease SbcCD ATPase subunit